MGEREHLISILLQICDAKNRQIEEMQKHITDLQKRLAVHEPEMPTNGPTVGTIPAIA